MLNHTPHAQREPGKAPAAESLPRSALDPAELFRIFDFPVNALAYELSCRVHAIAGERDVLETTDYQFDVQAFGRAGHCAMTARTTPHPQWLSIWRARPGVFAEDVVKGGDEQTPTVGTIERWPRMAWFDIEWEGKSLELISLRLLCGNGETTWHWVIGDDRAATESFFDAVCVHDEGVADEILVAADGEIYKDPQLLKEIAGTTFDSLVLPGELGTRLRDDFRQFLDSRELYGRFGVPWKRGALLLGPPGNGKTHCVKALVNELGVPCLYVRNFKSHAGPERAVRYVFARARRAAPCLVVLEDLDALVTGESRATFLNELDGFASNDGVLVLATTNHPERLDPAILDRPSRFDVKYHFPLPDLALREHYLGTWIDKLDPAMTVPDADRRALAEATDGFSFAYLKELVLASVLRWFHGDRTPGAMPASLTAELAALRQQMASVMAADAKPEAARPDDKAKADQ